MRIVRNHSAQREADRRSAVDEAEVPQISAFEHQKICFETALARRENELTRLRAEIECLQIVKQRFEAIVDNVPSWLFSCGSDGAVTFMNNGFARFTGKPADSALGDGWLQFVHPDDVRGVRAALGNALQTGISRGVTLRVRAADGAYVEHMASGTAVRDGNGKIIEWYGSLSPLAMRPIW